MASSAWPALGAGGVAMAIQMNPLEIIVSPDAYRCWGAKFCGEPNSTSVQMSFMKSPSEVVRVGETAIG